MASISHRILQLFENQPQSTLPTSEIIKSLYPEEYENIKSSLHDPLADKESRLIAKRHKGQLHRRVLYHLNQLVEDDFLQVTQIRGRGEKCFNLLTRLDDVDSKLPNHFMISRNEQPLAQLEWFCENKILTNFDMLRWYNRLNAIVLDFSRISQSSQAYALISKFSPHTNDVIGLFGFEQIIEKENLEIITSFLKKVDVDTRDNNKQICLLIDLEKVSENSIKDVIAAFSLINPPHITIVFALTIKYLASHQRLIKHIIRNFSQSSIKIHFQNKNIHEAPMLLGKAGVYTINDSEWNFYLENLQSELLGLCIGQVSVGVDISKYFKHEKSASGFREFLIKVAKSLVESSAQQRKKGDVYFSSITSNQKNPHDFFRFSTNYIRLWNYDWQQENYPHFVELLTTCSEEINEFARVEETIFKSCGIPIRFNIALASAHGRFNKKLFSKRTYKKITISKFDDLMSEDMQAFLTAKEKVLRVFNQHDRLRIFRSTPSEPDDVLHEMKYLISSFNHPLICYDFAPRRENLTLDQFMNLETKDEDAR